MDCKCPNCKGDAKREIIGGVEYIDCRDVIGADACGWFVKQADGTWTACEQPQADSHNFLQDGAGDVDPAPPANKKAAPSAKAGDDGGGSPLPPEPADDEDEDEGGLEITLTDEIDY